MPPWVSSTSRKRSVSGLNSRSPRRVRRWNASQTRSSSPSALGVRSRCRRSSHLPVLMCSRRARIRADFPGSVERPELLQNLGLRAELFEGEPGLPPPVRVLVPGARDVLGVSLEPEVLEVREYEPGLAGGEMG